MADIVFGILIKGKDLAASAFGSATKGAKALGNSIKDTAAKAAAAAKGIVGNMANFNAMLSIGRKAFQLASMAFRAVTTAALDQRAATDQQKKDWLELTRTVQTFLGLIGDILIPILLGVADAFRSDAKAAASFLSTQKEMIGADIVGWFERMALILTKGVATGLVLVTKAWSGWQEIVAVTNGLVSKGFEIMLAGFAKTWGVAERFAAFVGQDGIAASFSGVRHEAELFSETFGESADKAFAETARIVAGQEDLEAKIREVAAAVEGKIGQAAAAAVKRLGQEIKKLPAGWKEASEAAKKAAEAAIQASIKQLKIAEGLASREAAIRDLAEQHYIDRLTLRAEHEDKALERFKEREDKRKEKAKESADAIAANAQDFLGVVQTSFSGIGTVIDGEVKTWNDALAQFLDNIAAMILQKLVASGIAQIASLIGNALTGGGLGIFGAIGSAVSGLFGASAVGLNKGGIVGHNKGGIVGYAGGGIVGGMPSAPNRDTELIAATSGESIFTRDTTRMMLRDLGSRATAPIAAAPRQLVREVTQTRDLYAVTSRAHLDTFQRNDVIPSTRRLERYRAI